MTHAQQLELAQKLHASVRATAGLRPDWQGIGDNLRAFYMRMAASLSARQREFFGC